jgi:hypothetical protein
VSKKLIKKVVKEYEICRCLVTNIQSVTGHKTHEIISFLSSFAENCIKENDFNVDRFIEVNSFEHNSVKDYTYYPNTKIYLGVCASRSNVDVHSSVSGFNDYIGENMLVKYKFYTPTTMKKLTQDQFDDIVIDAMLTDFSMDFDPPTIKKPKTLVQKKQEQEEFLKREKERDIAYHNKELKSFLKNALKLKKEIDSLYKEQSPDKLTKIKLKELRRDLQITQQRINQNLQHLKNLGDKTHEVLLTPTDSIKS